MSRRSAVEQIVIEEKKVSESIFKLISAREKASAWHLKWAKFEEHTFLFFLFGKLAELRWIWNDLLNRFVDRHQEYYKTFKDIHYEERVIEDTKKTLQTCESSIAKLKKQMDSAQKRNDNTKIQAVDRELTSQLALQEHLKKNLNSRSERLSHFKVDQIQKGLLIQAQAGIQMTEHLRHLFIAQLRIADIVGNQSLTTAVICQMVSQVIIGLSNTLGIFPPPTGNVDPLPSPSESPTQSRKSNSESSPLPSPLGFSTSADEKRGRRSFPFPYRPLPQEPNEVDHPPQSHAPPAPKGKGVAFTRSASDVPLREHKSSRSPNHTYRTSLIILEESQRGTELPQTRSHSVSRASSASSLKDPATVHLLDPPDANHTILSKSPPPNQLILKQDSCSSLDPGKMPPLQIGDTASLGSESDPGYADPIDALREYYSSQPQKGTDMPDDLGSGPEISDPPYQTLAQIQERRRWQVLQDTTQNPEDDPTYSKPFDCLVGLAAPIRVTSEMPVPSRKLTISPLAMHRTISPDFSMRTSSKSHHRRHAIRRQTHKPSGSEETLSSSPSPEPDTAALLRHQRCTSLDSLLNPPDDFSLLSSRNCELRERVKSTGNLLDDKPTKAITRRAFRERIHSLGNLLASKGSYTLVQRPASPLALARVVSDQDVIPRSSSSSIVSPQPSPLHAPVPAEVTRLQNGYATVVHPEYS